MTRLFSLLGVICLVLACSGCGQTASGSPGKLSVVGAENFYGDLLGQIGGNRVQVSSILSDPNADPHEYESSSANARSVAQANLVIMNGVGYDAWMDHLLSASPSSGRIVVAAGTLAGLKTGDNPHIWYNLGAMRTLARTIAQDLTRLDGAGKAYYADRERRFEASLRPVTALMARIRLRHGGTAVAQTEPVFGYMLDTLHLRAEEGSFQRAVEEGNDPSPQSVIHFESLLNTHAVAALLYNLQTVMPVTQHMRGIAGAHHIPIIGVTETEPSKTTYQRWMLNELKLLSHVLDTSR